MSNEDCVQVPQPVLLYSVLGPPVAYCCRLYFDPIHLRGGVMNDQAAVIVRESR